MIGLLLEDDQGNPVVVTFTDPDRAEAFERRHQLEGRGIVRILTQTQAILEGCGK